MGRLRLVTVAIVLSFLAIWIRLFYWQVVSHEKLKALADSQHFYSLELPPARGDIVSSDDTPLVTNQTAYLVFAEKRSITDEEGLVKAVSPLLGEQEASISALLKEHEVWVPLKHQVEEDKVKKLRELKLAGLGFEREDKRYYPEASMAAHLLGFVGKDSNGQAQGYFGIEGYYNKELKGHSGFLRQERDAVGNPIVIGEIERIEPKNGRTLLLHINKTIQFIAEEKLKEGMKRFGAKAGTVVILEPATGGIIASASYPSYHPGIFSEFPSEYYQNPVVASSYEPGSTFKPLVMATAINTGSIKPTDTFDESGQVRVGQYSIKTWNDEYHGNISMTQILEYSSNVGMVHISNKLGPENILSFLKEIGVGEKTGVDVEEEDVAALRSDSEWHDIDYATASFGQGIALSPLQMVRSIATIANGGWLMEPHLVKQIIDNDRTTIEIGPKKVRQIFSSTTAKLVAEMMVSSVEHGEAKWKIPKGFRIAGKTGTAQIPVEGHYDTEKTIASFVGFGPVEDPRFVMLVTLREPETSPWGSETAAPLFFEIATQLLHYYGVTPK